MWERSWGLVDLLQSVIIPRRQVHSETIGHIGVQMLRGLILLITVPTHLRHSVCFRCFDKSIVFFQVRMQRT